MSGPYLNSQHVADAMGCGRSVVVEYAKRAPEKVPPFTRNERGQLQFELDVVMRWIADRKELVAESLDANQAAEYLGISRSLFERLFAQTGWRPKPHRIGRKYYYRKESLDRWAEAVGMTKGWRRPVRWNVRPGYSKEGAK